MAWKSFVILYAKLILYNLAGEPEIQEIQDGEIAVSGGCGGDIVGGGGGGVKQHAVVFLKFNQNIYLSTFPH